MKTLQSKALKKFSGICSPFSVPVIMILSACLLALGVWTDHTGVKFWSDLVVTAVAVWLTLEYMHFEKEPSNPLPFFSQKFIWGGGLFFLYITAFTLVIYCTRLSAG